MVAVNLHDLKFFLDQIKIAEANSLRFSAEPKPLIDLVPTPHVPYGLRTVDGTYNNLVPGRENYGAADQIMPRLLGTEFRVAQDNPRIPGVQITSYEQTSGSVYDSTPRTISNLVADQTLSNPAAIAAAVARTGATGQTLLDTVSSVYLFHKAMAAEFQAFVDAGIAARSADAALSMAVTEATAKSQALADAIASGGDVDAAQTAADAANAAVATAQQALALAQAAEATARGPVAELLVMLDSAGIVMDGQNVLVPDVAPDEGLTAPFNSWMTIFGQFFDHGLDSVGKGGSGTVYIPLMPDDPLYVEGSFTNFMVLTRATNQPGPDGILGTADDVREHANSTTPWVDLNQNYSSHPSHQAFLREFIMRDGKPVDTGHMLDGAAGGLPTWADIKAQALNMFGIRLSDLNVHDIPLLATDAYGNFIPGLNGFPQLVKMINGVRTLIEGNPAAPVDTVGAVATGHAFLLDIAHTANPTATTVADADDVVGNGVRVDLRGNNIEYDDELLDRHFIAGDGRANENFGLTAVHTLFHDEHNRQVEAMKQTILSSGDLAFVNEWLANDVQSLDGLTVNDLDWDGMRLFQSARIATEMQYQHMVFEEFARRVHPAIDAFVFNSITDIDPAIVAEFAHVVYRFGHSMLTENVTTMSFDMTETKTDLISAFLNPVAFDKNGSITADEATGAVIRGLTRETGNAIDEFITSALRDNLVGLPLDLAALNIARGRDTGVPSFNKAREAFYANSGSDWLKPYASWSDFALNLKNPASIVNFIASYGTHSTITAATTIEAKRDAAMALVLGGPGAPADRMDFLHARGAYAGGTLGGLNNVDFWIGGLAEKIMPFGGMLGATFTYVFEAQMENLQNNDRFYYLTRMQGLNMLNELENNSFASIIMKNTDFANGGSHLPGEVFAAVDYILEVDQRYQVGADPVNETLDPFLAAMGTDKVERATGTVDAPLVRGAREYDNMLTFHGPEHVVLGGTNQRDILVGDVGDDALWGDGGNDLLIGGAGVNHLRGGAGDDIIIDGGDVSFTHGEDGNDVIHTGAGAAELAFGGDGNDVIIMGEDDAKHAIGGEGDDFMLGGAGADLLNGGEGDDWIEGGGGFDVLSGDNSDLFFNSTIIGHDVMFAGDNENDFDAESGDDIMIQGESVMRNEGMLGYDWVGYKGARIAADVDLTRGIFATEQADILRNRYDRVEGVSGWNLDDVILGDDRTGATLDARLTVGQNETTLFGNELTQEGIDRIAGLRAIVGELANGGDFTGGNILLGGGGSDILMGRGGDDVIDGDRWLNVRIRINGERPAGVPESIDSLKEILPQLLDGSINPGQLQIVRELLDGDPEDTAVDTAVFWDIAANYTYSRNADGSFTVTHNRTSALATDPVTGAFNIIDGGDPVLGANGQPLQVAGVRLNPPVSDGTDRLYNIERLLFADGERFIVNRPATGAPVISDTTPTENQTLTADTSGIADPNGFGPGGFRYQWQASTDGGTTWTDVAGATNATYRPGQAQVGQLLRVNVSFVDGLGYTESLTSSATAAVVDSNVAPTGALTISDTTPQTGQTLFANSLNIRDANGFNPLTTPQTFQWQSSADGVTWTDITGATGVSFQPGAALAGLQLRATVTFTDGEGTVESVTSAATRAVGNTINGTTGADTLTGTDGDDVITGRTGNDVINAGGGDDQINWNANAVLTATDGRDTVDGGAGIDTIQITTRAFATETYRIYTRDAAITAGITPANANTEIVITRDGTAILHLDNIEEIVITGPLGNPINVTAPTNGTPVGGTANGDTVIVIGDFSTTSLALNTIHVDGSAGNDVVDISGLSSAHRIVFKTGGGNDVVVGNLRPQDVIELPAGADPASYVATDNGDGTVTMASPTHSVTFTGSIDALPVLTPTDPANAGPGAGPVAADLTVRDATGLLDLVRGINPDGDDDVGNALGVRDLTGYGNNPDNPALGAHGQPFIRITPNRSGELQADGVNNAVNPIFDGLDPRSISDIIGTQEAGLAKSAQANTFFMAFAQYFDHGLSFIPKGGAGTIQIGAPGSGARAQNPADLTRASVDGFDADGAAQHLNITSPYVDQNQVYGSTTLIGQLLRESDGNGGLGARVLMGGADPSAPGFKLLPQLRTVLEHHIQAGTVFTGGGLPEGGKTLLQYYPELLNADGSFNATVVADLARNFMGEGQPLLLDANPFINLLDHIVAGDGRANENVTLTAMHTIFARNHNLHVEQLEDIYQSNGIVVTPEELFQAAKIVNEAEYQRVVFTEFAEKLLGGVGIRGEGDHGFTEWNPTTDAAISQEFASAVYRFGHTMIGQTIEIANADGTVSQVSLFDAFLNPTNAAAAFTQSLSTLAQYGYIPQPGYNQLGAAAILKGIAGQPAEEVDVNVVDGVRNDLVRVSADLFSFNVARGRDVGIGTLNQVKAALLASDNPYIREALGYVPAASLQPYTSWEDFGARNNLSAEVLAQFRQAYPDLLLEDQAAADAFAALNPEIGLVANGDGTFTVKGIDRVDLWVGGLAEAKVNGGLVGSTFWVVIHEQLDRLQEGDRFYYIDRLENFDLYPNFVEGQSFADIVMRNTGLTGLNERIFEVSDEDNAAGNGGAIGDDGANVGDDGANAGDDGANAGDDGADDGANAGGNGNTHDGSDDEADTDEDGAGSQDDGSDDRDDASSGNGSGSNSGTGSGAGTGSNTGSGSGSTPVVTAVPGVVLMPGSTGCEMAGSEGDDVIVSGDEANALLGKDGADVLVGNGGNDVALGGAGRDVIEGGVGRDILLGGAGDDIFLAQEGDGSDMLFGGDGVDLIDLSFLSEGAVVDLGAYAPIGTVRAGGVTDYLLGIEDVIGTRGNDVIKASLSVNVMTGGDGADTFVFVSAGAADGDVITDFRPGDRIDLSGIDAKTGVNGNQTFTLAQQGTTAAGSLVIREVATEDGTDTIIEGFTDDDDQADFTLTVRGAHNFDGSSFNF